MSLESQIADLVSATNTLTSAVNVSKATLDAKVATATSNATTATTKASEASTSASQSAGSAAQALAIYGNTTVMQTAVAQAAAQASLAAGHAASASSVVQQDLSGVNAAALHRSPNAVTAMFVYDTSKDSDGGAWTEKCQHTSWYNEAINGKWLGAWSNEADARILGAATLGTERIPSGTFETNPATNGWSNTATTWTGNALRANFTAGGQSISLGWKLLTNDGLVAGKTYRLQFEVKSSCLATQQTFIVVNVATNDAYDVSGNKQYDISGNGTQTLSYYFVAPSVQTSLKLFIHGISQDLGGRAWPQTLTVDNVSIKEVTAIGTTSSDYYQSNADGKFYRLWKNLFASTNDLTAASWSSSEVTASANGGDKSVISIVPSTNTATHKWGSNVTTDSHAAAFVVEAKANGYSKVALNEAAQSGYSSATVSLLDGSGGTASTIVTALADGWYRIEWRSGAINNALKSWRVVVIPDAGVVNAHSSSWAGDGTSGILVRNPHIEYGSAFTGYEQKTVADTTRTETFRGNKRDFPRLAAIVAEAASVTIYDLTEAGRPMWMRTTTELLRINGGFQSLGALNGNVLIGASSNVIPFGIFNYIKDDIRVGVAGYYAAPAFLYRQISQRNLNIGGFGDSKILSNRDGLQLAGSNVNAVAMTVLPDAPVDPATGLKVPTIAVATAGGVSVIKHNGTMVNSAVTGSFTKVKLTQYALHTNIPGGDKSWSIAAPLSMLGSSFALSAATTSGDFTPSYTTNNDMLVVGRSNLFKLDYNSSRVRISKLNETGSYKSSSASVTNTFNTGHQIGDIRRTYLADIDAGTAGNDLVTNGSFSGVADGTAVTTLAGWSAYSTPTNRDIQGEKLRITATAGSQGASLTVTTVVGKRYVFSVTATGDLGAAGIYSDVTGDVSTVSGNVRVAFTATATSTVFFFRAANNAAGTTYYDNISVVEAVADRSYKAAAAHITGILAKTAVASAAQMVAYSGFSAANYLREPYSADLDFGTNEWSASAWVNAPTALPGGNYVINSKQFNLWSGNSGLTVSSDVVAAPDSTMTADKLLGSTVANQQSIASNQLSSGAWSFSVYAKASELPRVGLTAWDGYSYFCNALFDLSNGTVVSGIGARIEPVGDGWYRCIVENCIALASTSFQIRPARASDTVGTTSGPFTSGDGIYVWGAQAEGGAVATAYKPTTANALVASSKIFHRASATGPNISLGLSGFGSLTATAYDGTTTRTVTTTAAYNTASWLKAEACYTTDGTLSIWVNGQQVAATYGAPLLTLNNSNAVLTIGNSYAADAPFPGSIALLKLSATVPTPEQSVWMYEQEKQMFREGAQVTLPDSNAIADLAYDEVTDKWIAVTSTNMSEWSGLVRTNVTAVPSGSYSKLASAGGVTLQGRSTTNPGVDITIPAYGLRKELVKRGESAAKLNAQLVSYDYVGGFTATTSSTTNPTALTSVAGLSYPVSYIGAKITGTGIPTDTFITAVSGTTIYMSKPATATGTAVQISFTDFILPVGYEAKDVLLAGVSQKEGSTAAFTRLFDGFKETIRLAVAPSYTALIQVKAARSAQ